MPTCWRAASSETPDKEAVTDGTRRLTYRELSHGIDRMAARLRGLGIGEGDVVGIQVPNWIEFPFVFFALERLGAVAVTVSVDFRSRELEYILRFAGARMLVCCAHFRDFDHLAMAEELRGKVPELKTVGVLRGTPRPGMVSLDDVAAGKRSAGEFHPGAAKRRHRDAHGLHLGHDGQSQGRDAQPQHHARGGAHP